MRQHKDCFCRIGFHPITNRIRVAGREFLRFIIKNGAARDPHSVLEFAAERREVDITAEMIYVLCPGVRRRIIRRQGCRDIKPKLDHGSSVVCLGERIGDTAKSKEFHRFAG